MAQYRVTIGDSKYQRQFLIEAESQEEANKISYEILQSFNARFPERNYQRVGCYPEIQTSN